MKKQIVAALSLSLLGTMTVPAMAAAAPETPELISPPPIAAPDTGAVEQPSGLAIQVDGKETGITGCIMVPLRAVAEKLGFTVVWDNGVILIDNGVMHTSVTVGEDRYHVITSNPELVGMSGPFSLGCPPYVNNGVTFVPLGLFDALMGSKEGTVVVEGNTIQIKTDASDNTQIPNPFISHATMAEAAKAVGYALTAPETLDGSPQRDIQTMNTESGKLLQLFYGDTESAICVRKAPGSGDISGDYTVYDQVQSVKVNGIDVTMKGTHDLVHLAIWTHGGYTYSILAYAGMSGGSMTALVQGIK